MLALAAGGHAADRKVGDKRLAAAAGFPITSWDSLMPANWDPMKDSQGPELWQPGRTATRAQKALEQLRKAWDTAPTVPAMDGKRIRIAGFVVPP